MEDQIILSTEDKDSTSTESKAPNVSTSLEENSKLVSNSDISIYVALFASRYTNDDQEYKRAAVTISREPICISPWGPRRSHFDESDRFDSRRNREYEINDGNAGRDRNSANRNWCRRPHWRGRGNRDGNFNVRSDYRKSSENGN